MDIQVPQSEARRRRTHDLAAVRANASDDRALMHLEDLAERHKELFTEISDLEDQISKCRGAVEFAKRQQYADPNRIH
jgi:hypothetical protein